MGKKIVNYEPFYPTTVGTRSHDITLQKLPAYSIRPKPEIKYKNCKKSKMLNLRSTRFVLYI